MNMLNLFGIRSPAVSPAEILPPQYEEGPTLESLDHESRAEIARELLSGIARNSHLHLVPPKGLLTISAGGLAQLMNMIPGLKTLDADTMDSADIFRIVQYVARKQPALLSEVIAELSEEWPESAVALRGTDGVRPPFQMTDRAFQ